MALSIVLGFSNLASASKIHRIRTLGTAAQNFPVLCESMVFLNMEFYNKKTNICKIYQICKTRIFPLFMK